MKTALCFLMTLFLASAVLPSYAESDFSEPKLDLESLSDDRLLSVKEQVELEFLRRTEHFTLDMTPGVYVVGKNIAEGRYRISHSEGASFYFFI